MSPMTTQAHPFARLGPAPFRYLGMSTTDTREAANARRKADGQTYTTNTACGGTCALCGTAISDVHMVRDAAGAVHKIGSTCIHKHTDRNDPIRNRADRARRKVQRERRHAREAARIAEGVVWAEENAAALAALPHPHPYRAGKGETLADAVAWSLANAGNAGKLKTLRAARKAVAA